jgi:predicted PurR-regulated permease PerM
VSDKTGAGRRSLGTENTSTAVEGSHNKGDTHRPEEPFETATSGSETAAVETPPGTDVNTFALTVLAVIAAVLTLRYAEPVLIPVVLGVLISYVLGPMVDSLAEHGLSRWLGAALVITLLCAGLGYAAYRLTPQIVSIVDDMPEATQRLLDRSKMSRRRDEEGALERVQRAATEIDKAAAAAAEPAPTARGVTRVQVVEPAFRATDYLWAGGRNVLAFLGQFAMVLFLVFFLLVTGDLFKRKLVKIAGPTLTRKKITVQIMDDINKQISGFLRVQVITSVVVGVLTAIALWYFGLRQFLIWGMLAGIFNSVPYLGPLIVTGGLGTVAFIQFDDLLRTGYVCAVALAITSLEGWLLTPTLMSRAAQMNPVAIFIGLLFWSWVWGVWGTILAVPMMMTVKAICDRVEDLQAVGELLGE